MAGTVRKLIVEVVEARNLLPKDGMGTSSPYVVVDFDGQRRRTQTVRRDLNPTWNEVLEFDVLSGSAGMVGEQLEVDVYHDRKVGPSRRNNFLGRVRLESRQFVNKGEEALIYFPLEKKSFFTWIRGDIGLKIYYVDQPIPVPEPEPVPPEAEKADEPPADATPTPAAETGAESGMAEAATAAAPAEGDVTVPTEQPQNPATETPEPQPPEANAQPEASPTPAHESNGENQPDSDAPPPPQPEIDVEPTVEDPPPPHPEPEKEPSPTFTPSPLPRHVPRQVPAAPQPIERSSFDLVDKMQYLFVRVVRARSLPSGAKPHVRISASGRHASTRAARRLANFSEWDQTFAFPRDPSVIDDTSTLEVSVWDLPPDADVSSGDDKHLLGGVCFDVSEVPIRDPPDSQLAPQWYRLEGGWARNGDLMLATWLGTQADESFRGAWKADGSTRYGSGSRVYHSPKLWYLRATVIEVQDSLTASREIGISVRATLGFQVLKTRTSVSRNGAAPSWNEDLIFVAAEPFGDDEKLILQLEIRNGKDTAVLGTAAIPLSSVERRVDDRKVASRWLDLNPTDEKKKKGTQAFGRLHVRVCLDGGYHVADEPSHVASDFRPSARQLWKPPVGTVELGIIGCKGLLPMRTIDGKGTTDAFAVAKYGPKWSRTRTVPDNFDPAWNEQFTWEIHDLCTVLTVAVFDESDGFKDATCRPMGRIRIRISTLESNRPYRRLYPLTLLLPSGMKKMGEIEIAVRFARAVSALDLLHVYGQPVLPVMHYVRPIGAAQRDALRMAAARIVAAHLAQAEPSLKKEVVLWVLEAEPKGFSMRRIRANWQRIVGSLAWMSDAVRWMEDIRRWRNPTTTVMSHAVMVTVAWYPELIIPAMGVHVAAMGVMKFRKRPRGPEAQMWGLEQGVDRDELDEEWDPVPSGKGVDALRTRYDRLRMVGARVQELLGQVAAQTERVQALVSWRDPRATGLFVAFCLVASVVLFLVPARVVAVVVGFYYLRHPMFRDRLPPPAINFFRRLPSLSDRLI